MTNELSSSMDKKRIFLMDWSAYPSQENTHTAIDKLLNTIDFNVFAGYIAFPFATTLAIRDKYADSPLKFGVDAMLNTQKGCFTEPIAARLLGESQIPFAIIDKKTIESDPSFLATQIPKLLQYNVQPFICFGESLEDYQQGHSRSVLSDVLAKLIKEISPHLLMNLNLVYDPEWLDLLPSKPSLKELLQSYQVCREILEEQAGAQIGKEIHLIGALSYDLEDFSAASSPFPVDGFYFKKAGLHQADIDKFLLNHNALTLDAEAPESSTDIVQPDIAIEQPEPTPPLPSTSSEVSESENLEDIDEGSPN